MLPAFNNSYERTYSAQTAVRWRGSLEARQDLLIGDFHFSKTAGFRSVDGVNDELNVRSKPRPLLTTENHYRDLTVRKILLVADVLIGCQEEVKTGILRRSQ